MPKRPRPIWRNNKKMSVRCAFGERLKRAGKYKAWVQRANEIAAEQNIPKGHALNKAMWEFGYEGPDKEWDIYWEWADAVQAEKDKADLKVQREKVKEEKRAMEWSQMIAGLPVSAPSSVEMNWVLAHEAMTRKARDPKGAHVVLTADDIIGAEHGDCPSMKAANMLQLWVNRPEKLFEMVMSEQKKKTGDGEGKDAEVVEDSGADDIQRMLDDLNSAVKK